MAIHVVHVTVLTAFAVLAVLAAHHSAHVVVSVLTHVIRASRHEAVEAHWLEAVLRADERASNGANDAEADEAVADDYTGKS